MLLVGTEQGLLAMLLVGLMSGGAGFSLWFAAVRMRPQRVG
jgi:drug/metabolite transporter (DMT)-like permease